MERVVRKFSSFEEAGKADHDYYRGLTPQQRVDICLELSARLRKELGEDSERLARVSRIIKLPRG